MNTPSPAPDFTPEIVVQDGQPITTSLDISNVFEKNHRDVLRSIKDLEIPENYRERNFAPTFRDVPGPNGSVRKEPIILITRDGFTILAMGFTRKKGMEFKIKYIEAFNRMEAGAPEEGTVREKAFPNPGGLRKTLGPSGGDPHPAADPGRPGPPCRSGRGLRSEPAGPRK
ncbi:MAG: Phage regulatory protein, Rha family [Leptospirillum sp. Group IV 'UBA BS']|nr:MAG: Phage regulatory protein, Rha family [Leptospirillum sp. Group IV 'UBA BS']